HVRGVRRAVDLAHLEVDVLVEPVEQPLARAQDHRCRGDDELVDLPGRQRLADHLGTAADRDVTGAGGGACLCQRVVEAGDECEAGLGAGWSSTRWVSTKSGPGNGLLPPQAPAASYMPRPTMPDELVQTISSK